MKTSVVLLALAIGAVVLWAQNAPQTPPSSQPPTPHAHGGMMDMHQHMAKTQDQAATMRATLEKMKTNVSKISDPALKQQAQYDVDLWEQMVQHMESMSAMMNAHGGLGMGSGMGHMPAGHPPITQPKKPASDKK